MKPKIPWSAEGAACFFDGEGSVVIARQAVGRNIGRGYTAKSPYHQVYITAPQTSRDPLDELQRLFGGIIKVHKQTGKLPDGRQAKKPQKCWVWSVSNQLAVDALLAMLPWLTVKRARAELAIDFQKLMDATSLRRGGNVPLDEETIAQRDAYWQAIKNITREERAQKLK